MDELRGLLALTSHQGEQHGYIIILVNSRDAQQSPPLAPKIPPNQETAGRLLGQLPELFLQPQHGGRDIVHLGPMGEEGGNRAAGITEVQVGHARAALAVRLGGPAAVDVGDADKTAAHRWAELVGGLVGDLEALARGDQRPDGTSRV